MAFRISNVAEGVVLALDAMRASKLRSALTILGVVIGVTTVMVMASLVNGIQTQIFASVENASPQTFYVVRFFSSVPLNPDRLPPEVRARKVLDEADAEALRRSDQLRYAGLMVQVQQKIEVAGIQSQGLMIYGADNSYLEIQGGSLLSGRFFSQSELKSGRPVVVLEQEVAERLFGRTDPLGDLVRIGGTSFTVIGIYAKPDNIFQPPGASDGGIVPFRAAKQNFQYDETNSLFIAVLAQRGVSVPVAKDAAIATLRRARGHRPSVPNSFDVITQDQILDTITSLTSAFFLVMIALSSVALLVGGIGVMAIMMVSVTDRTHEIGLRKALGATKNEILWQFLVEAATLTGVGGLLGIIVGLLIGELLKMVLALDSGAPLWSAVVAVTASVGIGLVFGMIPAGRAARMDPVEALRHE
ncbi:MAG TPA: ABC transporter permease [Gemmatimonadales bacterium]|jgi:putative ABC transport system permease protein|nr:ABC transporter permease [Gemmatimonadales bacterium]